jgi:uncharacterized membrane protein YdjX (TVP38/TMEM64 family)
MMATSTAEVEHQSRTVQALRWVVPAVVIILVGAAFWLRLPVDTWLASARAAVLQLGGAGVAVFTVAYAIAIVLFAPAAPLTLAAGALYGAWGLPIALAGAMIGAVVSFAIARSLLRAHCAFLCSRYQLSASIDRAVAGLGWRAVLLMRLTPMIPFAWENYAFGMTGIRFRDYWVATLIGMLPATLIKVWLGSAGASTLAGQSWPMIVLTFAGVLAMAGLVWVVVRRLRDRQLDPVHPAPASSS